MNRYILNDFGFFSTKIYIVSLNFMTFGSYQQTYFGLPHNISDESARKKICEFISKNIGEDNNFLYLMSRSLLYYLLQWQNGANLVFWDQEYGNEILNKILSQIPAEKSLHNCYFETNGETKLQKMLADILIKENDRFAKNLFDWKELIIEPLVLKNFYNLS